VIDVHPRSRWSRPAGVRANERNAVYPLAFLPLHGGAFFEDQSGFFLSDLVKPRLIFALIRFCFAAGVGRVGDGSS